jgi:hypothetical protein
MARDHVALINPNPADAASLEAGTILDPYAHAADPGATENQRRQHPLVCRLRLTRQEGDTVNDRAMRLDQTRLRLLLIV